VKAAIDSAPLTPPDAIDAGLIDGVFYRDELKKCMYCRQKFIVLIPSRHATELGGRRQVDLVFRLLTIETAIPLEVD
jgi:hypothetical protein